MSGAYVAKPPAPFIPFVPPEWNPNWIFPGPLPPGFSVNTMYLSADSSLAVGGITNSVSGGVMSDGPSPTGKMRYSATVDGALRNLRIGDSGPLTEYVELDYTDKDNFWGSQPQLYFATIDSDAQKTLILTASGSPFSGEISATANISIQEPETPGITVTPTSGLVTTSRGGQASFTVQLNSKPKLPKGSTGNAYVNISLLSNNTNEGKINKSNLSFNSSNYNHPQTVTITGQEDNNDSQVGYSITILPASSNDPNYNSIDPTDPSVTNKKIGFIISPISLNAPNKNSTISFSINLRSVPDSEVRIDLFSSNTSFGTIDQSSMTFSDTSPQIVTVTGQSDSPSNYEIIFVESSSSDKNWNGITPDSIDVNVACDPNDPKWQFGGGVDILQSGTVLLVPFPNTPPTDYRYFGPGSGHVKFGNYPSGAPVQSLLISDPDTNYSYECSVTFELNEPADNNWYGQNYTALYSCGVAEFGSDNWGIDRMPIGVWTDDPTSAGRPWRLTRSTGGQSDGCGVCTV